MKKQILIAYALIMLCSHNVYSMAGRFSRLANPAYRKYFKTWAPIGVAGAASGYGLYNAYKYNQNLYKAQPYFDFDYKDLNYDEEIKENPIFRKIERDIEHMKMLEELMKINRSKELPPRKCFPPKCSPYEKDSKLPVQPC